jgi:type IV pilus assembly protein PilM
MASSKAVWGIDIGQSGLKALRCTAGADGESIVAEAYDYIEYPKILSSPDADAAVLVAEALEQFLSRNELVGDSVAVAVPGQAGLSRFFKPPPVDAKTLPDIVKYEVKQQIPFPLEDVIWDWQRLGGTVVDDVTVDAEVGLFAMKREAVFKALKPFTDSDIEVDVVQLAPLATFNVVCHDILENVPEPTEVDMDNPPESLVVLSIGTDTTDLIITNGIKLWLRNIPIGGNHFTKQLARELKLTTNKAELLKRNARQAEDPKTVFQAMRSVFSDLVTEIQRSLSYFQGLEKNAKIKRIALMGNAAKLPGLRQFLNKQLDLDIIKVGSYRNLKGDGVVKQKSFEDNILTFAPCYGLCLQGLGRAHLKTNLLPQEFVTERMIRAKKPWTLAAVSTLMLGMTICFLLYVMKWAPVQPEYKVDNFSWKQVTSAVDAEKSKSNNFINEDRTLKTQLDLVNRASKELSGALDNKATWLELISAIYQVLPKDDRITGSVVDAREIPFEDRKEIYIGHMESQYLENLNDWKAVVGPMFDYQLSQMDIKKPAAAPNTPVVPVAGKPEPGWIVEIAAYHFYNSETSRRNSVSEITFVRQNLIRRMLEIEITLPGEGDSKFKLEDLGIEMPTVVRSDNAASDTTIEVKDFNSKSIDPDAPAAEKGAADGSEITKPGEGSATEGAGETAGGEEAAVKQPAEKAADDTDKLASTRQVVKQFNFVVQFAWTPRSPEEIRAARQKRIDAEAKAAKDAEKSQPAQNQNDETIQPQ